MVSKGGTTAEEGTNGRGTGKAEINARTTAEVPSQGTIVPEAAPPSTKIGRVQPATIRTLLAERNATDVRLQNPEVVEAASETSALGTTIDRTIAKAAGDSTTTVKTAVASTMIDLSVAEVKGTSTTTIGHVPHATTQTSPSGMHAIDARLHGQEAEEEADETGVTVATDARVAVTEATGARAAVTEAKDARVAVIISGPNATMLMEAIAKHEGSVKDTLTINHRATSVRLEDSIVKTKIEVVN